MTRSPLEPLANPGSIVLFGASPAAQTIGGGLTRNLLDGGFAGTVHLVNPKYGEIAGHPCHSSLAEVPGRVDLALIATPAATVAGIVEQCGKKRVKAAVVYSAGFAETGAPGDALEADLVARAQQCGVRLLGPRALGVIRPHQGLNATPFQRGFPAGNLAFVSQSGAVCTGILDWVFDENFALSAVFSPGNGSDLNLADILDFLAADPQTESILLYLEGIRDSRRFMSALRTAARAKPVVVVKAGRTPASAAVAQSHTLATVGDDQTFDAALARAGALRVRSIGDLFSAARALTSPRRPQNNRLAVISNGGGPAIMAADMAADCGIDLPTLAPETVAHLGPLLPPSWSLANPVDILFGAEPAHFAEATRASLADPGVDAVLVIVSPSGFIDPTAVARAIIEIAATSDKPILACCMGESSVREARRLLAGAQIPVFRTPESAVTAFAFMVDFVRNQRLLLETPPALASYRPPRVGEAGAVIAAALESGRRQLAPDETAAVLAAFHIPTRQPAAAPGDDRAVQVRIRRDRSFGPVIGVSEAGSAARHPQTGVVVLPPLNDRLAAELLDHPRLAGLLPGDAAAAAALRYALGELLLHVSGLACELPWIDHLELDATLAGDDIAVGRAQLAVRPAPAPSLRYPHMAICPYPSTVESWWRTRGGLDYTVRPIRPEDAAAFQNFVRGLSDQSKYYRFFGTMRELPPRQLARRTQIDYDREMVLVAVARNPTGDEEILAEANYGVLAGEKTCEFGVVVADHLAGQGIGSRIMGCLQDAARARGMKRMIGEVLSENEPMQALMDALDFSVAPGDDPATLELSKPL